MTGSHSISVHPPPEGGRGRRPSKVRKTLAPQKPYNQGQWGDMAPPFSLEKTGLIEWAAMLKECKVVENLNMLFKIGNNLSFLQKSLKKGSKMWKWQGVSTQYQIGEKQPFSQPWRGGNSAKMTEKHTQVEFSILALCIFCSCIFQTSNWMWCVEISRLNINWADLSWTKPVSLAKVRKQ